MVLNEEQLLLKDTIATFFDDNAPVGALRALRDTPGSPPWKPDLWKQLSELGVAAATLSEQEGGLGFGWLGFGTVMAEQGRRLCATPLLSSIAFAMGVIRHCSGDKQRSHLLPKLSSGTLVATVAYQETNHFHPLPDSTREIDGCISGRKVLVMDASGADLLLITALRQDGELGICALPVDADGISIIEEQLFDGRKYARIELEGVKVDEKQWLEGADVPSGYQRALDEATLALCCEMMGGARELLERTVAYLNEREQFGVKIGSFQALQHRCAQAYCSLELAESAVLAGLTALDRGTNSLQQDASRAKAMAGDVYEHISNEATQLHGGMGVTDEMDVGLFLKRSRVCNQLLGDGAYHRDRFARLRGF